MKRAEALAVEFIVVTIFVVANLVAPAVVFLAYLPVAENGYGFLRDLSHYPHEFRMLPLDGCWWGILAAEVVLLAAYISCANHPPSFRLLTGWLAGLVLLASWMLGAVAARQAETSDAWNFLLPESARPIYLAVVIYCGAQLSIGFLTTCLRVCWISARDIPAASNHLAGPRWGVRELLILTTFAALTLILFRYSPQPFQDAMFAQFDWILGLWYFAAAAVVPLFVLGLTMLIGRSAGRLSADRVGSQLLVCACLVGLEIGTLNLGLSYPFSFTCTLNFAILSAFLALTLTCNLALLGIDLLGWQLDWQWPGSSGGKDRKSK